MRLRHKKPLNPYKGQTNNDKNEFNDDDFKQQGSPHKKAANGSTDQIYKYARILSKFIKTINQEYNAYQLQPHPQIPPQPPTNTNYPSPPHTQNPTFDKPLMCEQIKQQKQITKIQSKKQPRDEQRQTRTPSKKRDANPGVQASKQNKNKALENSFANSVDLTKNTISAKTGSQVINKNEKEMQVQKEDKINKNGLSLPSHLNPSSNSTFNLPNPKVDENISSMMGINGAVPNPLNFTSLFNPSLMSIQMFRGLTPVQLGQLSMGFPSYMPINLNMPMMNMGINPSPFMMIPTKPFQNLFNQQVKVYNNKITPIETKNIKEVYPLKRSAFHVTIAYKIYLDKLKKQGNSFQKLEDIDPTKYARRIKNSQAQNNTQNGKPKQGQKKKK